MSLIRIRKKKWIGQALTGEVVLKDVIEGRMEVKKGRGRPRVMMLNELTLSSYWDMKRRAKNRTEWRRWMPWTCR